MPVSVSGAVCPAPTGDSASGKSLARVGDRGLAGIMSFAPAGLILALNVKGFRSWDPKVQVVVALAVAVVAIVFAVNLVRRHGWVSILFPLFLVGIIALMGRHSGCLEHAGDLQDAPAKKP